MINIRPNQELKDKAVDSCLLALRFVPDKFFK